MIFDETYPVSFNNFQFYMDGVGDETGKKVVVHEYPNSNKRFVEELGLLPKTITFRGFVYGSIQNRLEFENKLNEPGLHQLVHPFYGTIDNVMAGPYQCLTRNNEYGVFRYDLTFYESSTDFAQVSFGIDLNTVSINNLNNIESIFDKVSDLLTVPTFVDGFLDMVDKVDDILQNVYDNLNKIVNPITNTLSLVVAKIKHARGILNELVSTPEKLAATFEDIYKSIMNTVESPEELRPFFEELQVYALVDAAGTSTEAPTINNIERSIPTSVELSRITSKKATTADNIAILDEGTRLVALSALHTCYVYEDQKTTKDIKEAKKALNEIYDTIVNDFPDEFDSDAAQLLNDIELRDDFATIKNNTIQILNDKLANAWNIITERTGLNSISLLSYNYYESLDDIDTLIGLNVELNVSSFDIEVDVLGEN